MNKYLKYCLTVLVGLTLWSHQSSAQVTNYKAYSIFIYSFTKYVNWPAEQSGGDFVITVVGKSKVVDELQLMAEKKTINGRPIMVRQVDRADELAPTHILFVSEGRSSAIDEVTEKTQGQPVLIVTERDGLVRKGACISFVTLEDKSLRFEMNEENMLSHRLIAAKSLQTLAFKE